MIYIEIYDILTSAFLTSFMTVIWAFNEFIKVLIFWVNTEFLKALTFSLIMQNVIHYFEMNKNKVLYWLSMIFYMVFLLATFLLPYYYNYMFLKWWEWLMLIPYIIGALLGTWLKYTQFGKEWLNYYRMCLYYVIISVLWCLFVPSAGNWVLCLVFGIIVFLMGNIGGFGKREA